MRSSNGRVKLKTIKLVFFASLQSTQYYMEEDEKLLGSDSG
jgi:hypothetical protein